MPIKNLNFRDNIDTDIAGANLYNLQIQAKYNTNRNNEVESIMTEAKSISSILVRTGVYQGESNSHLVYSHKDAKIESKQKIPDYICDDVFRAVEMVFEIEKFK